MTRSTQEINKGLATKFTFSGIFVKPEEIYQNIYGLHRTMKNEVFTKPNFIDWLYEVLQKQTSVGKLIDGCYK